MTVSVLQHRGQDAAGIMTNIKVVSPEKVQRTSQRRVLQASHAKFARFHWDWLREISYCRFIFCTEAQPFYVNYPFGISLAHNGNLTNADEIKKLLTSSTAGM